MTRYLILSLFAAGCIGDASATTESDITTATGGSGDQRKPPKEAVDACASSAVAATCAFDIDSHHVTGTCKHGPDGGPLACVPDRPPPPPEAIAACATSSAGATCSFDVANHHVDGSCHTGPDASAPLACAPAGLP